MPEYQIILVGEDEVFVLQFNRRRRKRWTRKLTRKRKNQGFRQERQERQLGGQKKKIGCLLRPDFLDSGRWKHMTEKRSQKSATNNICCRAELQRLQHGKEYWLMRREVMAERKDMVNWPTKR